MKSLGVARRWLVENGNRNKAGCDASVLYMVWKSLGKFLYFARII